jgi:hypothetical protein
VQAGSSGCQSFAYSWWFFLPSVAPASHTVWFLPVVAISDLPVNVT